MRSKRVKGKWLSVERCIDRADKYIYEYKFGGKMITYDEAVVLIKEAVDAAK